MKRIKSLLSNLLLITLLLITLLCSTSSAQLLTEKEIQQTHTDAEAYLDDGNFNLALFNYQKLLATEPDCAYLHFQVGLCHYEKKQYPLALKHFQAAHVLSQDNDEECLPPIELLYFHAKTLYFVDKPDLAISVFAQLNEELDSKLDKDFLKKIEADVKKCINYLQFIENPIDIKIENLGEKINSPYAEYSPALGANDTTLFFTSRRPKASSNQKTTQGEYYEDIFFSVQKNNSWQTAHTARGQVNSAGHDACLSVSHDGKEMLIYKAADEGSIFLSRLEGQNWSKPEALNRHINTSARETHACFSPDGKRLYFTSNRKGGFGGLDIYVSERQKNNSWGAPKNLGARINTRHDEEGPFMHKDGRTLYFSSKGHGSIGGYDIFSSVLTDNNWTTPENLGYPINTSKDDVFIIFSADGHSAYFSSFKEDTFGETDLYRIVFNEARKQEYVIVKGKIDACNERDLKTTQLVAKEKNSKAIVGMYRPNKKTGEYIMILSPGQTYYLDFDHMGNSFHSDTLVIDAYSPAVLHYGNTKIKGLPPCDPTGGYIAPAAGRLITRIYFRAMDYDLNRNMDLNEIAKFLKNNPNEQITISGLTANDDTKAKLFQLAAKRNQSIKYYLLGQGVPENQIKTQVWGPEYLLSTQTDQKKFNHRVEIYSLGSRAGSIPIRWTDPLKIGYP